MPRISPIALLLGVALLPTIRKQMLRGSAVGSNLLRGVDVSCGNANIASGNASTTMGAGQARTHTDTHRLTCVHNVIQLCSTPTGMPRNAFARRANAGYTRRTAQIVHGPHDSRGAPIDSRGAPITAPHNAVSVLYAARGELSSELDRISKDMSGASASPIARQLRRNVVACVVACSVSPFSRSPSQARAEHFSYAIYNTVGAHVVCVLPPVRERAPSQCRLAGQFSVALH